MDGDLFDDNYYKKEEKDLLTIIQSFDYKLFLHQNYIQIWIIIGLLLVFKIYYNGYKEKKRIESQKKQPFNKNIVEKNDENVRIARLKSQEAFREDLKTLPIPKESPNESNFDHTKKVKPTTNKKFAEGLNPSGSGSRLSFNLGTRR